MNNDGLVHQIASTTASQDQRLTDVTGRSGVRQLWKVPNQDLRPRAKEPSPVHP
jgi:hypothetical protein